MGFLELFGFFARMTWLPAVCFIAGFGLVIFEMFYPGFGVPGISGSLLLFLGVVFLAKNVVEAIIMIIIILAVLGIVLAVVLRSAKSGMLSRNVVLSDSLSRESGFSGTEDLQSYVGREGFATTTLRPAGTAEFDGEKMDVVSQSEFIPKGTKVRVIKVEGRRMVVDDIVELEG